MKLAYTLALVGGIVTIVVSAIGFLFAIGITFLTFFLGIIFAKVMMVFAVIGAICGILMLHATKRLKRNPKKSAVFLLVVSIIAMIMSPLGIGGVLGIIAAIIVLAEITK